MKPAHIWLKFNFNTSTCGSQWKFDEYNEH